MQTVRTEGDPTLRTAVILIAAIMGFGALHLGSDIFAPMVLGVVAGVILAPVSNLFERWGLPAGLASTVVLVMGVSVIAVLAVLLEPMVWRVAEELPNIKWELRAIIEDFRGLIRGLDAMNREVEEALGTRSGEGESAEASAALPDLSRTLLLAPLVLAQVMIFGGTLFFFLFSRRGMYAWLSDWIGTAQDTEIIQQRFVKAERLVSRYFLTISVINAVLGALLATALTVIGLPAPVIWGILAGLLNFILYVGPMAVIAGLLLAGLVAFEGLMVLAPAAIFLCLNMLEAQFVTPAMVGKHISVNPLLIFVSLVFWLWLWGPIGGIIAIPVLVIFLVMSDIFDPDEEVDPEPGRIDAI